MQRIHVVFNGINVSEIQIWKIEHCDVPKKKIDLAFEIDLPVNETKFSKTTITKNDTFSLKLIQDNIGKY